MWEVLNEDVENGPVKFSSYMQLATKAKTAKDKFSRWLLLNS